jgi:hypothetical protein
MSTGVFLLILLAAIVLVALALRAMMRLPKAEPRPNPDRLRRAAFDLERRAVASTGSHLDDLDTVPENLPLADLLAARSGPPVAPQALERRAERLHMRFRSERRAEPMRALARLLIDCVDAGLPDAYAFHDAARVFFAHAPAEVLAEFAPEAEARFNALTPWLSIELSTGTLRAAQARVPGPLDNLLAAAEARAEKVHVARVDALLASIGQAAAEGRSAHGDALILANYVTNRPGLAPRVVSEMAMHKGDPIWTTAWLMLETREIAAGREVNLPAFRNRVMAGMASTDPAVLATAADALHALLDASAAGDMSVVWSAVGGALNRTKPAPAALIDLADRLGIARPDCDG